MARTRTYFISDLHLGASSHRDSAEVEKRVVTWLDSIKDDASDIYMLGDILDYWYEYKYVVPKGYIRFFGKLAELSDAGVKLHWILGNHDVWLYSYFQKEIGIEVLDGNIVREICGKRIFMAHGDGCGYVTPFYKFIRALFRNKFCQMLYGAIHPRWSANFANMCSLNSRKRHKKQFNKNSQKHIGQIHNKIDLLKQYCEQKADENIDIFIFGHFHSTYVSELKTGAHFYILNSWHKDVHFAVIDDNGFNIK